MPRYEYPDMSTSILDRNRNPSREELQSYQLSRLNQLLKEVLRNNAFYRERYRTDSLRLDSLEALSECANRIGSMMDHPVLRTIILFRLSIIEDTIGQAVLEDAQWSSLILKGIGNGGSKLGNTYSTLVRFRTKTES